MGPYHMGPYHMGPYHLGPYHMGPYHMSPYHMVYIIPFDIIQIILLELQTVLSILIKEKMKRSNKGLTWIQFQFHRGLVHAFKGYFDLKLECDYRIVRMR